MPKMRLILCGAFVIALSSFGTSVTLAQDQAGGDATTLDTVKVKGKGFLPYATFPRMFVMIDNFGVSELPGLRKENKGVTESQQEDCDNPQSASATSVAPKTVGNPVVLSTGNKIEPELDFVTSGEMPLFLQRTYNHYWPGAGLFGKHWVSSFDYKLTFGSINVDACYPRQGGGACGVGSHTSIYSWRPDGRVVKYVLNVTEGIYYEDKPSAISRIVKGPDGHLVLFGEDNEVETYSSAGYVVSVRNAQNIGWDFAYTSGTYPKRVTHTSGRYVEFVWTGT